MSISLLSSSISPSTSEPSKAPSLSDDIEAARNRSESDLKSEEIFCNYGDNVVLDDVSEEADSDIHKPLSDKFLGQVHYFVGNRIYSKEMALDLSPIGSEHSETEDSDSKDSSSADLSSLGPSKSYSSINDYLNSLAERKLACARSGAKYKQSNISTGTADKAIQEVTGDGHCTDEASQN